MCLSEGLDNSGARVTSICQQSGIGARNQTLLWKSNSKVS